MGKRMVECGGLKIKEFLREKKFENDFGQTESDCKFENILYAILSTVSPRPLVGLGTFIKLVK